MWKDLRAVLARLWQWSQKNVTERRQAQARARFWAGVREGEREAEARSTSLTRTAASNGGAQP
jgi:hypothetical protein